MKEKSLNFTQVMKQIMDLGKSKPRETALLLPTPSPALQGNPGSSRQIFNEHTAAIPSAWVCYKSWDAGECFCCPRLTLSGVFWDLGALGRLREGSVCLALTSVDDGEFTVEMF